MIPSNTGNRKFSDSLEYIHNHSIDVEHRIIYIHSALEAEESGVDFKMAVNFVKNIDYLDSISNLALTLNTRLLGSEFKNKTASRGSV